MRSGEPIMHQSDTCVYCSLGVRKVGWSLPNECWPPMIIMSGSAQQPGADHFQYSAPMRDSIAFSIHTQASLRSSQLRQQFAPASRAHSSVLPMPYWQKE